MAAGGSELGSPSAAAAAAPPPKRRKIEPSRRDRPSQVALDRDKVAASSSSLVSGTPPLRVDLNKVREAKRYAVFQAQHEGCLGSYKSFDSSFGSQQIKQILVVMKNLATKYIHACNAPGDTVL